MRKFVTAALALLVLGGCTQKDTAEDPYLWLEDVGGEEALAWVEEQNEVSLSYLEALPTYEPLRAQNLENYASADKLLTPGLRGHTGGPGRERS